MTLSTIPSPETRRPGNLTDFSDEIEDLWRAARSIALSLRGLRESVRDTVLDDDDIIAIQEQADFVDGTLIKLRNAMRRSEEEVSG